MQKVIRAVRIARATVVHARKSIYWTLNEGQCWVRGCGEETNCGLLWENELSSYFANAVNDASGLFNRNAILHGGDTEGNNRAAVAIGRSLSHSEPSTNQKKSFPG